MFTNKSFKETLNETYSTFKNSLGLDIQRDIADICADETLRATLIESYTSDIKSANQQKVVGQLMENAADEILTEDGITSVSKIASLSFPVIRKLWASVALKDALAQKVAETPAFAVVFAKPYVIDASGKKHYITGGEVAAQEAVMGKPVAVRGVELAKGATGTVDFAAAAEDKDIGTATADNTMSTVKVQGLDAVKISITEKLGTESGYADSKIIKSAKVGIDGMTAVDFKTADDKTGTVIARGNRNDATVTLVFVSADVDKIGVIVDAEISQEFHETPTTVAVEYSKREVSIPTGEHFSANVTVESTQDLRALYNIDNVSELVNTITNLVAQNLEVEIRNFLEDAITDRATDEYDFVADKIGASFDCKAAKGYLSNDNYALSASSWRSELGKTIDYVAAKIVMEMHYKVGSFRIVGNPLDTMLLTNVNWEYNAGDSVDGVELSYSRGVFKGAYTYQLVSSPFWKQGALGIFFLPSADEKALTYVYYPYSFNTETSGYIDRANSKVPSIMVKKRHTLEKCMPASGFVKILNNTEAMDDVNF